MSSGWLRRNRYLIRMSYDNVIMSSGWHRLPSLSHPDEIVNFDFPHHAVALQRFRNNVIITPAFDFLVICWFSIHYSDVIMSAMASQITGVSIVYSTVCLGSGQRKHQSSASLAFVKGSHWWPVQRASNAEFFPFDDVIIFSDLCRCCGTTTNDSDRNFCHWSQSTNNWRKNLLQTRLHHSDSATWLSC